VLYAEQLRLLEDEEILLKDTTTRSESSPTDWTLKRTYNLSLSKAQFVLLEATVQIGSLAYGAGQITIDNITAVSSGELNNETQTIRAVAYLAAGSYTIDFDLSLFETSGGHTISFTMCKVARFNFPDKTGANYTGSDTVNDDAVGTLINQDFTLPAVRKLPFGDTKGCLVVMTACCFGLGGLTERIAQMQDDGSTPTLNKAGFRIYVDDSQQAWTEKNNDYGTNTSNMEYGKGGFGRLVHEAEAGDTINIKVKVYNNTGGSLTLACRLKVAACVWWLSPTCEPVTMTRLPFQSTLYVTMEPLWANPTKTLNVGKARIGEFSGCDYYSNTSGADIVDWNYTFETVDPEGVQIFTTVAALANHGACIGMIGADIR
jgi:hypothetical protein